jgi:hypothetical protein
MVVGNVQNWAADLFPTHLIPAILELVLETWDKFKKPNSTENENPISSRFAEKLRQAKNEADLPFKIRPEVQSIETNGRIDILFDYTGTNREEVYFAFECKRLRIPYENRIDSNASQYIGEQGMMCFITGKYSAGLNYGGMIAYVMDGKANEAIIQVEKSMQGNKISLCLINNSFFITSSLLNDDKIKETNHQLSDRIFTIYHVFLAV